MKGLLQIISFYPWINVRSINLSNLYQANDTKEKKLIYLGVMQKIIEHYIPQMKTIIFLEKTRKKYSRLRIITMGNDNTTSQYQTSEQAQFYTTIEMKTILSSFDRSKYNYSFRMFNVDQLILHSSYEPLENKEITNNYIINVNQFNIDTFQIGQLDNLFHSKIILIRLNLDSIQFIM